MQKLIFALLIIIGIVGLSQCLRQEEPAEVESPPNWRSMVLKDVRDGVEFRVSDFYNKPVFLNSFSLNCSECKLQHDQMKELHKKIGNQVVSVSVGINLGEVDDRLIQYVEGNNYDWLFSEAPDSFVKDLVKEFGLTIINSSAVPVVLVCPNDKVELLELGIKNEDQLNNFARQICN